MDTPPQRAAEPGGERPSDVPLSQTRAGRRLLNVAAVVLVGSMLVSNLPSSELRDRLSRVEQPVTDVTGLSQNWALFAPDPRSTTLRLRAEIEREDGSTTQWTPPVGDRFVGVYRTYRWRKWAGAVVNPDNTALHRGAVTYLRGWAADRPGPEVVEIRLYRGVHRQPGIGSGEAIDRDPAYDEELLLRSVERQDDGGTAASPEGDIAAGQRGRTELGGVG